MLDSNERRVLVGIIVMVCLCQLIRGQSTAGNAADRSKKHMEEVEETNEANQEKELAKIYSSAKANAFLTYDKCMQRMKCPANRKEECSEECTAGNTEEEIEEHDELTRDEKRASLKRAPRLKYEPTASSKKQSSKSKQSAAKDQPATGKPDL